MFLGHWGNFLTCAVEPDMSDSFPPLESNFRPPSSEMGNFTNRDSELKVYQRMLALDSPAFPPVLMFYGVGGTGKTWLLKRLHKLSPNIPRAYIDLDPATGGNAYANNTSRTIAEIRRQLGTVDCPRFDLAYTWLRVKEGIKNEPQYINTKLLECVGELAGIIATLPAGNTDGAAVYQFLVSKVGAKLGKWLGTTAVGKWLQTDQGKRESIKYKDALPNDIYPQLTGLLLSDLSENLPRRNHRAVRAVVFVDTVESIRDVRDSESHLERRQEWLKELYHPGSGLLIVLAGRDKLNWDDSKGSHWEKPEHLEQHLVGGLSNADALAFLTNCGIDDPELQQAILQVSLDLETVKAKDHGYHPLSLGLCADTCFNVKMRGEVIDSKDFEFAPDDLRTLTKRFLRSLGQDGTYSTWLYRLALTPRFDEKAALDAFGSAGADQDAAWSVIQSYSFFKTTSELGFHTFHAKMKEVLDKDLRENKPDEWRSKLKWWSEYWKSRSDDPFDRASGLSWYHDWQLNPEPARLSWQRLAEEELRSLGVANHSAMIEWWDDCNVFREFSALEDRWDLGADLHTLGSALIVTPLGDRSENLQRAINCFEQALRIYTKNKFPADWAATLNGLGNAYCNLPTGNRAKHVQRAIDCYTSALSVYTKDGFPQSWAMTQNNLGNAYCDLPSGNPCENLARAIECYDAALQVRTEHKFPQDWATTQNNLGTVYGQISTGDRSENLKRAIECFDAALRVRTEDAFPQSWALIQYNLGNAYFSLPEGDRSDNLTRAIKCFNAALRIRTEDKFPQNWAMTMNSLGAAYSNLSTGDQAENLNRAIECFEDALRFYKEYKFPQAWAMTQNNLGTAHSDLPTGDRAENLRRAIECYEAASRVYEKDKFSQNWAKTQLNLGAVYSNLSTGDWEENLRRAIECYEAALPVYTEDKFPRDWAAIQHNLGAVYSNLPTGHRAENLNRAIKCYEAALRVYTEDCFPEYWAKSTFAIGFNSFQVVMEWQPEWEKYGWEQDAMRQSGIDQVQKALEKALLTGDEQLAQDCRDLLEEMNGS